MKARFTLIMFSVLFLGWSLSAQRTITGTITSAGDGQPLIGANVLIQGTSNGTTTDIDGTYSLTVNSDEDILVYSYTGFLNQEVIVGTQTEINVSLAEATELLDEVVVTGYGTQKRGDVSASISSIDAKELDQSPVASLDQALQGRAAGVQVSNSSGQPGAGLKVQIRGATSITASSEPLYVVDGIPMTADDNSALFTGGYSFNSMADINPDDIESIEILKDASSAAIYGSRGANGVVLITTKRGKSGEGKIELDVYTGWQAPTKVIEMMDSREFIDMMNDAAENDGLGPEYFSANGPSWNQIGDPNDPELTDTDWYGEILRDDAPISNYSLSFSGGTDKSSYFVSASYFDQEGFQKGTAFDRISGRANLDFQVKKWFKVGTNTFISRSDSKSTIGDNSLYGVMINALAADPTMPVLEEDGSYADPFQYYSWWAFENPRAATDIYQRNTLTNRALASIYGEASILPNLKLKSSWAVDYSYLKDVLFYPSTTLQSIRGGIEGQGQFSSAEALGWLNENTLTWNQSFGNHNLIALAGFTMQQNNTDFNRIDGQNFANDNLTALDLAADITNGTTSGTSWGLQSYLGRVNYNYANKYYLTASLRVDGSSRFGSEKQYGVFPSASVAWRVSQEPFLSGAGWLYDFKVRASYGITGNQDGINNFASRALWSTAVNYNGQGGAVPTRMGNSDLGWEQTSQLDLGFDLSVVDGRVNVVFDYFDKRTSDLLLNSNVPGFSGFTTVTRNIGEVRNRGVEFALTTVNVDRPGGFRWSTSFNISSIQNEITKLEDDGQLLGTTHILKEGYPLGTFNLIQWQGVDPQTGNSVYDDFNGDGVINSGDAQIIEEDGKALTVWPDYFGGITNNFSYKGIEASIFLQYSKGNHLWNHSRYAQEQVGWSFDFGGFFLPYGNNTKRVVDGRWQQPGDETDIPRAGLGHIFDEEGNKIEEYQNWQEDSDQWLEDASYLRVKTVELAYNLPKSWISGIGLDNVKIYFRGQNLFTSTNYLGVDPEVSSNGESITRPGEDFGGLGQPKTYLFGIKFGL